MPNWVKTELEIIGTDEQIQQVKDFVLDENGNFDFERIVPYPKYWECPKKYLILPDEITPSDIKMPFGESGLHVERCSLCVMEAYPFLDWYNWRIDNWGTKWNACDSDVFINTIYFDTAWSFAAPVIGKLSELFPDIDFFFKYADEDIGRNCGSGTASKGDLVYDSLTEFDTMELAIKIWDREDDYKIENGKWKYIEE